MAWTGAVYCVVDEDTRPAYDTCRRSATADSFGAATSSASSAPTRERNIFAIKDPLQRTGPPESRRFAMLLHPTSIFISIIIYLYSS